MGVGPGLEPPQRNACYDLSLPPCTFGTVQLRWTGQQLQARTLGTKLMGATLGMARGEVKRAAPAYFCAMLLFQVSRTIFQPPPCFL